MSYNFRTVVGDWSRTEDKQGLEEIGVKKGIKRE